MKYFAKPEILNNDDLAEVAWEAIEPLWDDLPYSNAKKLDVFLADVTEGQKALISIDWCQKEIRNGGIKQLLENSTGNLVPYAIEGFNIIGACEYASILSEASQLLGHEYPKTASARKKVLKALADSQKDLLKVLDDKFFKLLFSKDHDIEKYRGNYVKENPTQFISS